ncbi:hypothetical protein Tco_1162683 [Tanacetum coccineum]
MLRVLQELSLQEQVGITQGNRGFLHVTTAKGKDTCPNNALNQGGNRMVGGASILGRSKNPRSIALQTLGGSGELSRVHNTFQVSNLKKCHADEPLAVPLDGLNLDDKLHFVEEPVEIVGREVKRLKRSQIPLVKVRWNSKRGPEFTWEREDQFKKKYPHLFTKTASSSSAASHRDSSSSDEELEGRNRGSSLYRLMPTTTLSPGYKNNIVDFDPEEDKEDPEGGSC